MNATTVFLQTVPKTQVYRGCMNCTQRTSAGSLLKHHLYTFDVPDARRYLVNAAECQLSHSSHWCCKYATQTWVGGPQASARINRKCGDWGVSATLSYVLFAGNLPVLILFLLICRFFQRIKMELFRSCQLCDTVYILFKLSSMSSQGEAGLIRMPGLVLAL